MKGSVGVELGVAVALLWGSVDILITASARHLGTLKTSIIAQTAGMFLLALIGFLVLGVYQQKFSTFVLATSLLLGLFSGLCAAFGYFAFYSALKLGPVALISPLTASSSCITFLLAVFIHEEPLSLSRVFFALIVIIGVVLSSTNSAELRQFLQNPRISLFSIGIRWAILAMLAFGFMDLVIGVSASMTGWFLPVLWTRFFSLFFLLIFLALKHLKDSFALEEEKHGITILTGKNGLTHVMAQATLYRDNSQTFAYIPPANNFVPNFSALSIPHAQTKVRSVPASLKRIVMLPLSYSLTPLPPVHNYAVSHSGRKQQSGESRHSFWWQVAILAGIVENMAVLIFSFDTRIITIGITSALASCYGIVGAFFGVAMYGERLTKGQLCGIGLCLLGIFLLTL